MKAHTSRTLGSQALGSLALLALAAGTSHGAAGNDAVAASQTLVNQSKAVERIDLAAERSSRQPGAVYVTTNQLASNEVVAFSRAADGTLSLLQRINTGGLGTQGPTESQDAVVLNEDNTLLFVANVSSDDISVFSVDQESFELAFVQRINSGGDRPVSLDVREDLLYVVNSGLRSGINGYRIGDDGRLTPIEGSSQPLSFGDASPFGDVTLPCTNIFPALESGVICNITQPAEIEFSPDGEFLVVSERLANQFSIYQLDENGVAGERLSRTSNGESPFGMHFTPGGQLLVAEAFLDRAGEGSTSSYNLTDAGDTETITDSLASGQATGCWIEVTPDGRYAYQTNPGDASITGLRILDDGGVELLDDSGVVAASNDPRDIDISAGGRYVYVLNNGAGSVDGFRVNDDGTLDSITSSGTVLPFFGVGLAAF